MNHLNEARLLYFQEAPITEVLNEIKKENEWFSYDNQEWIMNNIVLDEELKSYPVESSYKRKFLLEFNKMIEKNDQVANDSVLIELSKFIRNQTSLEEPFYYTHFAIPKLISNDCVNQLNNIKFDSNPQFLKCRVARSMNEVGLRIWEAAFGVVEWAISNPKYFEDKTILELGAGIGFSSLMFWCLFHTKNIVISEYPQIVLDTLKHNVEINEDLLNPSLSTKIPDVSYINFYDYDIKTIQDYHSNLIVVADVVYEESIIDGLCSILYDLLQEDPEHKKKALVVCTLRNESTFEYFLQKAEEKHLIHSELNNQCTPIWYYPNRSRLRFVEILYKPISNE